MANFTFERIKALGSGQYKILQLEIDGIKQLDKFSTELKGTDYEEEYEFRTTNLRLYAVQGITGKIIVLCGYKKDQTKNIHSFRALKKQIFQAKKTQHEKGRINKK